MSGFVHMSIRSVAAGGIFFAFVCSLNADRPRRAEQWHMVAEVQDVEHFVPQVIVRLHEAKRVRDEVTAMVALESRAFNILSYLWIVRGNSGLPSLEDLTEKVPDHAFRSWYSRIQEINDPALVRKFSGAMRRGIFIERLYAAHEALDMIEYRSHFAMSSIEEAEFTTFIRILKRPLRHVLMCATRPRSYRYAPTAEEEWIEALLALRGAARLALEFAGDKVRAFWERRQNDDEPPST